MHTNYQFNFILGVWKWWLWKQPGSKFKLTILSGSPVTPRISDTFQYCNLSSRVDYCTDVNKGSHIKHEDCYLEDSSTFYSYF